MHAVLSSAVDMFHDVEEEGVGLLCRWIFICFPSAEMALSSVGVTPCELMQGSSRVDDTSFYF